MSDNKNQISKNSLGLPVNHQDPNLYLNRELSLLEFNRRVIAQAEDESLPLLERLRYLCIGASNLDEFFEVRISSQLAHRTHESQSLSNVILHQISQQCHELVDMQYNLLNKQILPKMAENGIHLLLHEKWTDKQKEWANAYFEDQIRPALTPIVLDPAHPFPKTANKSLNFIVSLSGKDVFGRGSAIAIVKAPRILPRIIKMPDELVENGMGFCLLSSLIIANLASLFPDREILSYAQFRVTRDSDLWVDEEEVKNLRQALKTSLQSRQYGRAVRLEISKSSPQNLAEFLMNEFKLDKDYVYRVDGPVNLVRLNQLFKFVKAPSFYFKPYEASIHPSAREGGTLFEALKEKDILLHHPYQSFRTVIDFIRDAADDPDVIVIKQTIYRVGEDSELMQALIDAANRGKEVIVVVEIKARFDEEQNIDWAQQLENAGAQVIYGVMGLKTHAKLALVIRREQGEFHYYAHLGTGNYHGTTTKLYTDFGLLTAHPQIAREVNDVFVHITSITKPQKMEYLWLAPFTMHRNIIRSILNEVRIARQGRPAHIIAKMNSLIEESTIRALYVASSAGVKVDLIVRGACSLRPGVPGLSENIRVHSIIGRFLEHERIYYFRNDLKQNLYLSSADWMGRNLFRRIEVAFPVLDPVLKRRVIEEGLRYYIKDNTNSWVLQTNGQYKRRKTRRKQVRFGAQQYLASVYDANAEPLPAPPTKSKNASSSKGQADKARKSPDKAKAPAKKTSAKAVQAKENVMPAMVEEQVPVVNKDVEIMPPSDVSSS
ncbi:MAG: polyphosphate kinase 1 [Oxalobacter sp.]|nr:polyphosphate kinase 1 [Oxalobacter sp.]